ncbi:MAG: hypothetical protein HUU28_14600 [Planctomycetaceae bacterium]|nr:hypothetical protein [Planctomycetaceae bacterium]
MIQILFGDEGHKARCMALAAATPGAHVSSAGGPAIDKHMLRIDTLTFWGHGDAAKFCGLSSEAFAGKVKDWMKWNPTIKTVEIITCNSRHGTLESKPLGNGQVESSWVKSYTDQVKPKLKKLGLVVKALPMGLGSSGAHRWSILKFSPTTNTWLYVTADGARDTDSMWPGVHAVEQDPLFQTTKNFVVAGQVVKAREVLRKYTLDFGTVGQLRNALITLA